MSKGADMRALTDMQAVWVSEVIANGGNGTDAAIKAGYAPSSAAVRASELRKLPHVQEALRAEMRKSFTDLAAIAVGQARLMLLDPKTPASARVDLIKAMLDRAGLGVPKGDEEDAGDRPVRELTLVQLEAMALRVTLRPAQDAPPAGTGPLLEGSLVSSAIEDAQAEMPPGRRIGA